MAITKEYIVLNEVEVDFIAAAPSPVVICPQFEDRGRAIKVSLKNNREDFPVPEGYTPHVYELKYDKKVVDNVCEYDGNTVMVEVTKQMSFTPGDNLLRVALINDETGAVAQSIYIVLKVTKGPNIDGAESSGDELNAIKDYMAKAATAAKKAEQSESNAAQSEQQAKIHATAAQTARKGAEDAEERVNAIVAGNENYTKQEVHDRFALALKGSADAASSITIYPDEGSNVEVTVHGFTIQQGQGDPVPPALDVDADTFAWGSGRINFNGCDCSMDTSGSFAVVAVPTANPVKLKVPSGSTSNKYADITDEDGTLEGVAFDRFDTSERSISFEIEGGFDDSQTSKFILYVADETLSNVVKAVELTKDFTKGTYTADFKIDYITVLWRVASQDPISTIFKLSIKSYIKGDEGNVRKIITGGQRFIAVTITGDEVIARSPTSDKQSYFYQIQLSNLAEVGPFIPMTSGSGWHLKSVSNKFPPGNPYSEAKKDLVCSGKQDINNFNEIRIGFENDPGSVEAVKALFKSYAGTGNPLIVWCPLESGGGDIYAPLGATGGKYTGRCLDLTAPLFQGDTLITKVKSGCDKKIVFDGSEDEDWKLSGIPVSGYVKAYISAPGVVVNRAMSTWLRKGDFDKDWMKNNKSEYVSSSSDGNVCVQIETSAGNTIANLRSILSAKPLTVWYRSVDYVDNADKPVSMEMHARWAQVLNGKEGWATTVAGAYYMFPSNLPKPSGANSTTDAISDYLKAAPTNDIAAGTEGFGIGPSGSIAVRLPGGVAPLAYMVDKPLTVVYQLNAAVTFAHEPVDFIASPDEDGAWVITGESNGKVSAKYNKNITHTIAEIQAAMVSMGAHLSL